MVKIWSHRLIRFVRVLFIIKIRLKVKQDETKLARNYPGLYPDGIKR